MGVVLQSDVDELMRLFGQVPGAEAVDMKEVEAWITLVLEKHEYKIPQHFAMQPEEELVAVDKEVRATISPPTTHHERSALERFYPNYIFAISDAPTGSTILLLRHQSYNALMYLRLFKSKYFV